MRALVLLALAAAAADVTVGTDDEPTPAKTADKLRAALAKGDPVIELGDDILLDGAPAVAFHDAVIEGNNSEARVVITLQYVVVRHIASPVPDHRNAPNFPRQEGPPCAE